MQMPNPDEVFFKLWRSIDKFCFNLQRNRTIHTLKGLMQDSWVLIFRTNIDEYVAAGGLTSHRHGTQFSLMFPSNYLAANRFLPSKVQVQTIDFKVWLI